MSAGRASFRQTGRDHSQSDRDSRPVGRSRLAACEGEVRHCDGVVAVQQQQQQQVVGSHAGPGLQLTNNSRAGGVNIFKLP